MQTENTEKTEEVVKSLRNMDDWHPVYSERISYISSQKEWQELWDKAKTADELVGLLFRGLKISLNDEEAYRQISFYFEIAYGRNSNKYLCSEIPSFTSFGKITISKLSQKVCLNAWKFLCQDFFKDQDKGRGDEPSWFYQLSFDHRIVDKIIWFFSEKDNCFLSSSFSHEDKIAIDFLVKLAEYTWSSINRDHEHDLKRYLRTKRVQMLIILWNIKKLDILEEEWRNITKEDLKILKVLALIANPGGDEHKYNTVDEAMLAPFFSQPAEVYTTIKIRFDEKARQDKIKAAERQFEEANQELLKARKA